MIVGTDRLFVASTVGLPLAIAPTGTIRARVITMDRDKTAFDLRSIDNLPGRWPDPPTQTPLPSSTGDPHR